MQWSSNGLAHTVGVQDKPLGAGRNYFGSINKKKNKMNVIVFVSSLSYLFKSFVSGYVYNNIIFNMLLLIITSVYYF